MKFTSLLSGHNPHRASHSKLLSSLYTSEAKTSRKEVWTKGQGSACIAQCVNTLTYHLFIALNSKNCLPKVTIRFLCSVFPVFKRESWGNHGKYMQLFSEYPPWCAVSFPGTAQNYPQQRVHTSIFYSDKVSWWSEMPDLELSLLTAHGVTLESPHLQSPVKHLCKVSNA